MSRVDPTGHVTGSSPTTRAAEDPDGENTGGTNANVAVPAADAEVCQGDHHEHPGQRQRRHEGFALKPPPAAPLNVDDSQGSGASGSDVAPATVGHGEEHGLSGQYGLARGGTSGSAGGSEPVEHAAICTNSWMPILRWRPVQQRQRQVRRGHRQLREVIGKCSLLSKNGCRE